MISLKLRNYTRKEKAILMYIFREGMRSYIDNSCHEYCEFCQNANACSDIERAMRYLTIVKERGRK